MAQVANDNKTRNILATVGHELKVNPPAIVNATRRKSGPAQARRQSRAILLSKARKMGARIPKAPGRTR